MVHIDVEMLVAYWINWCAIGVGSSRCLVLIACLTTGHWKNNNDLAWGWGVLAL